MENVSQIIKKYNKQATKANERFTAPCNCRNKDNCPMNGNCRVESALYKCVVSATEKSKEMFTLALPLPIGSIATTVTSCHSKTRNTKMRHHFQFLFGSLRNQQKKPLSLHGQL